MSLDPKPKDEQRIRDGVIAALLSVAPDLDGTEIRGDRPLRDDYDLDSADFLNIIIRLHETFGVDVPESDYGKLTTIDQMVQYLESH